jgi:hypothetical protein
VLETDAAIKLSCTVCVACQSELNMYTNFEGVSINFSFYILCNIYIYIYAHTHARADFLTFLEKSSCIEYGRDNRNRNIIQCRI